MKIAVFYPTQIRNFNPFDNAERKIFEYLAERYNLDITLFVDTRNNYNYSGKFLKIKVLTPFLTLSYFPLRILNKIVHFIPTPMYPELIRNKELKDFDLVLTENPWYPLSLYPYFQSNKYILVDSEIVDRRVNGLIYSVIKKADGIIATTPLVEEKYKRLRQLSDSEISKIKVVGGHPIDAELFKPSDIYPDDRMINIVSTGRLVYEKGFHIILEAFKEILKKHQNIFLHIIGDGPHRRSLGSLATKYKLTKFIKFHGNLSPKEISEIYKYSHIFINHSLSTSRWQEYFGVANLEAMSSGIPVITTDCGAIPLIVKENAIKVNQGDTKELVDSIDVLIQNKNLRISLGQRGRSFVQENYTVEKIGKRYYSIMMEHLDG